MNDLSRSGGMPPLERVMEGEQEPTNRVTIDVIYPLLSGACGQELSVSLPPDAQVIVPTGVSGVEVLRVPVKDLTASLSAVQDASEPLAFLVSDMEAMSATLLTEIRSRSETRDIHRKSLHRAIESLRNVDDSISVDVADTLADDTETPSHLPWGSLRMYSRSITFRFDPVNSLWAAEAHRISGTGNKSPLGARANGHLGYVSHAEMMLFVSDLDPELVEKITAACAQRITERIITLAERLGVEVIFSTPAATPVPA
jgi:hypothetical protein